jgi:hypothetical protein
MANKNAKRVILLASGISAYRGKLPSLSGPENDPVLIYAAAQMGLPTVLDQKHSIALIDTSGAQFIASAEMAMLQANKDKSLLIIYFSGHGEVEDDSLELCFGDHPSAHSRISIERLLDIHRISNRPELLLILDCCRSGTAGSIIAKNATTLFQNKVAVLSATMPHQQAYVKNGSSPFTEAICHALGQLYNENKSITADSLFRKLKRSDNGAIPQLYIQNGTNDVIIAPPVIEDDEFNRLHQTTFQRIKSGRQTDREALWFALSAEPERLLLSMHEHFLGLDENIPEPSWLVRRAMGSSLASIEHMKDQAARVVEKYIASDSWMNIIVGLNASKKILPPGVAVCHYKNLLKSGHPMDVNWLCLLYMFDINQENNKCIDNIRETGLFSTSWGLIETYQWLKKAPSSLQNPISDILEYTISHVDNCDIISTLRRFSLLEETSDLTAGLPAIKSNFDAETFHVSVLRAAWTFHKIGRRGPTGAKGVSKWLRSKLYGTWRGAVVVGGERKILGNLDISQRNQFLKFTPHLVPDVARRMAIFEALDTASAKADLELLRWVLEEPHPWVRRSFLEYLIRVPMEYVLLFASSVNWDAFLSSDRNIYPGHIDLLFQAGLLMQHHGISNMAPALGAAINCLPAEDAIAISHALRNEGIHAA